MADPGASKYGFPKRYQGPTTFDSVVLEDGSILDGPGGPTTAVQYNDGGLFNGSANMTFNGTNLILAQAPSSGTHAANKTYVDGAVVPAGSTTELQYNNAGAFGGTSGVTWNGTTMKLEDNKNLSLGTSSDMTLTHNATDSSITNTLGHLLMNNTASSKNIIARLGGTSTNERFVVQTSAAATLFQVAADGFIYIDGQLIYSNKGAVTQSSEGAGVTLNNKGGIITTASLTIATNGQTTFTVTNSACFASSLVLANVVNYTGAGLLTACVTTIASGSFGIRLQNCSSTTALNAVAKIGFIIV
jgi:hypothetical protein